jgi:hypothetical protein
MSYAVFILCICRPAWKQAQDEIFQDVVDEMEHLINDHAAASLPLWMTLSP